jgi:hypothetical protein
MEEEEERALSESENDDRAEITDERTPSSCHGTAPSRAVSFARSNLYLPVFNDRLPIPSVFVHMFPRRRGIAFVLRTLQLRGWLLRIPSFLRSRLILHLLRTAQDTLPPKSVLSILFGLIDDDE